MPSPGLLSCPYRYSRKPVQLRGIPRPNIWMEFPHALSIELAIKRGIKYHGDAHASDSLSILMFLILAITWATCMIVTGSFLPLTIRPFCHFSFFKAFIESFGASFMYLEEA